MMIFSAEFDVVMAAEGSLCCKCDKLFWVTPLGWGIIQEGCSEVQRRWGSAGIIKISRIDSLFTDLKSSRKNYSLPLSEDLVKSFVVFSFPLPNSPVFPVPCWDLTPLTRYYQFSVSMLILFAEIGHQMSCGLQAGSPGYRG